LFVIVGRDPRYGIRPTIKVWGKVIGEFVRVQRIKIAAPRA